MQPILEIHQLNFRQQNASTSCRSFSVSPLDEQNLALITGIGRVSHNTIPDAVIRSVGPLPA